ncbi:hypothetical protein VNI00_018632 [Paramarasmius palmivorus]|uniref:Zn(2)-C6 fungal-type domain-containing protein n=1 Tax=Paramarasmius palmivorus TaxID=297713 RepID=A0AAW0AZ57_9AGAR
MPTPIRNPFAPPPPPQPKPRKLKTKREEPIPQLSAEEVYDLQLAMYERANALVAAFLVYYDSVFNKEAEFLPTGHTVVKLIQAQKDNIYEYHKICVDEHRGFEFPKSYYSVLLQLYRLTNMAADAGLIARKDFASWLPSTKETEALIKKHEDYNFHSPLPPPVRPKATTPPPVASSSKGSKRKNLSSTLDISDSEPKPAKRSKIQLQVDSSSDEGEESEEIEEEESQPYSGGWSFEEGQTLTFGGPKKSQPRPRSPSPEATARARTRKSPLAPKTRGKDKSDREKALASEIRGPRSASTHPRVADKVIGGTSVSSSGQREAYHPPAPPHPDEDDGYVADELSTAGGHVYLQGNVQLSYDSVISATSIAPEPNFYTQGCDRCIQKGLGCSPRADGHAGCTGCKSTNQKCSFTQSLEETLAARDEQLDLGLQGHNGLVLQLEGLLSTTSSLQGALDMQFLATQHVLRLNQQLERQRILFLRSTRDPRVICALLRLLHPNEEALTNERLVVLLTALRVPHSSFDLQAAGFKVCGKEILVVDMSTDKTLATYQQVASLAESAFPPVDLAKWLEARVGPEYVIKDKAAPEDSPGSPMAQDSKLAGPSSSPAKASGSTVKTASPRSVLDVPPSSSNIKDSKTEKKGAGSKSPMAVEKVGGSSSGDRIVDKSLREKSASPDSE